MAVHGSLARAGRVRHHMTPHVPKQHEKRKKTLLRTKCNRRVSNDEEDDKKRLNKPGLSVHDIERQLSIRDKNWMLYQKHKSFEMMIAYRDPNGDNNTKKPFKKHRHPLDEFYFQEFVAQPFLSSRDETEQVEQQDLDNIDIECDDS